jgi:hypothetical protein
MGVLGLVLMSIGIIVYLLAFAKGPGPTMGDDPVQATLFTIATGLLIGGFVLAVVI